MHVEDRRGDHGLPISSRKSDGALEEERQLDLEEAMGDIGNEEAAHETD